MYRYGLFKTDIANTPITESMVPHASMENARSAALDDLATRYVEEWPVEVRIYEDPANYVITWYTVWKMDVDIHAVKRIEEASKKEFADLILRAMEEHERLEDQYSRGLITPLEYARGEESAWIQARVNIESKMSAGPGTW